MKKCNSVPMFLAVIWTMVAAVRGCRWREVEKGKERNFDWDRHTLEVKTEGMSSLISGDKQLEIVFTTEENPEENVLQIRDFHLTQIDDNGDKDELLNFDIMLNEGTRHTWTPKPLGELRWTFKKNEFLGILVKLAGSYLYEQFPISDEDKTGMFQFGSEDNISLLYRVNSTDGDCVETGTKYHPSQ